MKKLLTFFFFLPLLFRAQDTLKKAESSEVRDSTTIKTIAHLLDSAAIVSDTMPLNEITVSFAPVISFMTGGLQFSDKSNFNIGYRRYLKNGWVIRTAMVLFPTPYAGYDTGIPEYDRTVNNVNVFRKRTYGGGVKTQFNFGIEKIVKKGRFAHGLGVELFANQQYKSYDESYFWRPFTSPANPVPLYDSLNYSVDSLGYKFSGVQNGGGIQLLYCMRYKLGTNWYLSMTVGPSVNLSVFKGVYYFRNTKREIKAETFNMDFPNVPFISDVSICFRF
jgi:hypothetical protein